jgi:hypothetical protein
MYKAMKDCAISIWLSSDMLVDYVVGGGEPSVGNGIGAVDFTARRHAPEDYIQLHATDGGSG